MRIFSCYRIQCIVLLLSFCLYFRKRFEKNEHLRKTEILGYCLRKPSIMAKFFTFALLALVGILQYQLWFSPTGIKRVQVVNSMIKKQEKKLANINQQNAQLAYEISDLKHKEEEIESKARLKLGMIKEDEVFYQVID